MSSSSASRRGRRVLALALGVPVLVAGCSSDDTAGDAADGPSIVVTHSLLGDVVRNVVGDEADVEVVMPEGADPHDFEPSAAQVASVASADLVVANGYGFEAGLLDVLDAAAGSGVDVVELGEAIEPRPEPEPEGGDHEEDDHGHGDEDPHWFTDPIHMATAVGVVAEAVEDLDGVDQRAIAERAEAYTRELRALDEQIVDELSDIPAADRLLLTNHEVVGYFADRYDFEVIGTVIPSGSTLAEPSGHDVAELVDTIEGAGVPAVFADTSAPADLLDVLVREVGDEVEVVELFSESLGEEGSGGETYLDLVRTNATRIHDALT